MVTAGHPARPAHLPALKEALFVKKKILSALLAGLFLLGALAGCGGQKDTGNQKVLRVGFEGMTVPTNWTQDSGDHGAVPITGSDQYLCGFEVAYMKAVCERAGYQLQAYKYDWDGLMMAVSTGKVDCAISMISPTAERQKTMDFTSPYYRSDSVVLVQKSGPYAGATSLEALSGARVTSMLNTLWYRQIDAIPGADKQPALESVPAMLVALQSGKVDCLLMDRPTAQASVIANPDLTIAPLREEDPFDASDQDVSVAIALPRGSDQLRRQLNEAIAQIPQDQVQKMMDDACRDQPLNR